MDDHPSTDNRKGDPLRRLNQLYQMWARHAATEELWLAFGPPAHRAVWLTLLLDDLLRQGPSAEHGHPGQLLRWIDLLAFSGIVPLHTPAQLRARLHQLGSDVRASGAWAADTPLWWEVLPEPLPSERLVAATTAALHWPCPEQLRKSLSEGPDRALHWPQLLGPDLLTQLACERDIGLANQTLRLAPEGVGAEGARSQARTDEVCYLSGLEPDLLAHCPTLAALIQQLLARLPELAAAAFPDQTVFPPGRVMLTRYHAPSGGYRRHLDNPSGANNGRVLTFTLYLNPPDQPCQGGQIAVWSPADPETPPTLLVPADGGHSLFFDAKSVPHQVQPLLAGERWTLVLWVNERSAYPPAPSYTPPELLDLLLPLPRLVLPPDRLAFLRLSDQKPSGSLWIQPRHRLAKPLRIGAVTTVYRGAELLPRWCTHHLGLGFDHLIVIFDHLDDPEEQATAAALRAQFSDHLTVWSGPALRTHPEALFQRDPRLAELKPWLERGGAPAAICARQALGATAALAAAQEGAFGGLDWLIHLDADEWFWPEGDSRGGSGLSCFAAAQAAGFDQIRFVNHERLSGTPDQAPSFKINPRLAIVRLGQTGWREVVRFLRCAAEDPRPWFTGYHNGKSAVAVKNGLVAAGVHGWYLQCPQEPLFVAGPCVLHQHLSSPTAFARKYLAFAAAPHDDTLFPPAPVTLRATARIAAARAAGFSEAEVVADLEQLYHELGTFTPRERDFLAEAGLLFTPFDAVEGGSS